MREIKFRARRINDGEFVYGQYVAVLGADGKKQSQIITKYTFNERYYEVVDPETVQQFCGYDDNDEEVYEDDIVADCELEYVVGLNDVTLYFKSGSKIGHAPICELIKKKVN